MTIDSESYHVFRFARTVLEMVGELHQMGYAGLRIYAGMSPSGMYWRVEISAHECTEIVRYSSGERNHYFGWDDAEHDTPHDLALKFCDRFPALVRKAEKATSKYAAWYADMLRQTAPLGILRQYSDWYEDYSASLPVMMFEAAPILVPLPPDE